MLRPLPRTELFMAHWIHRPLRDTALPLLIGGAACLSAWSAQAQSAASPAASYIYQCTNASGRILTSDRQIAECSDREQRIMTRDGVVIRTLSPSYTAEERVAIEAKQAKQRAQDEAKAEAVRRDRQLLQRFSNDTAHAKAREAALEPAMQGHRISQQRLRDLEEERKPLRQEAEFYQGKALPIKLKMQFDSIDAAEAAMHSAIRGQKEEMARINENYDIELERLKRLWAGAMPGSLGAMRESKPAGKVSSAASAAPTATTAAR